jgi:hypothetical protein
VGGSATGISRSNHHPMSRLIEVWFLLLDRHGV